MNQDQVYYDDGGGASGQVVDNPQMITLEPFALGQIANSRLVGKMESQAMIYAVKERYKARLAQEVMFNTMSLVSLADRASAIIPSSEPYVHEVVRAYTLSSLRKLAERM